LFITVIRSLGIGLKRRQRRAAWLQGIAGRAAARMPASPSLKGRPSVSERIWCSDLVIFAGPRIHHANGGRRARAFARRAIPQGDACGAHSSGRGSEKRRSLIRRGRRCLVK